MLSHKLHLAVIADYAMVTAKLSQLEFMVQ